MSYQRIEPMAKKSGKSGILILIIIILIIVIIALVGLVMFYKTNKHSNNVYIYSSSSSRSQNPINGIVLLNTVNGTANHSAILEKGIIDFNESYINYLLSAFGTSLLHKSTFGYGNPKIELDFENEAWNSEFGDVLITKKGNCDKPDLKIKMSKEEAVLALLSSDIKQYMKDDVTNGKIQIEMVAGKFELYSKGYLDMYKSLTGKSNV
jgi:hypothetical protein